MKRTSNREARQYVINRIPFKGSNTFGEGDNKLYVVYSYGYHFPMFIWNGNEWIGNNDTYSRTTSKHLSQLNPLRIYKYVSTEELLEIISRLKFSKLEV